jgi:hypothetical protein
MAHFAHINEQGIVDNVIVIDQETLNLGHWGDPSEWVQTSYNTIRGTHVLGGTPLRGNYAGIGYIYDKTNDVFYPQRPVDRHNNPCTSWTISAPSWVWEPPTPMPVTTSNPPTLYAWDESMQSWEIFVPDLSPPPVFMGTNIPLPDSLTPTNP